jgi:multiple sugar transport system substrate-binding protein
MEKMTRRQMMATTGKALGLLALASLPAACGGTPAPTATPAKQAPAAATPAAKAQTTINFITPGAVGLERTMYENFVFKFMQENPDIKVNVSFEAWNDYMTKLPTMLAGGVIPDMIHQHMSIVQDYAQRGALLDLKPLMDRDKVKPEDYIPALFDAFSNKGKTYGIPKDSAAWGVYYNKTMFDAAKVPYPKDDWTMDDFRQIALQLTIDEKGNPATSKSFDATKIKQWGYAWGTNPTPTDSEQMRMFFKAMNADWYSEDYKQTLIAEPASVNLLKMFHEMRCVQHSAPMATEAQGVGDVFRAGLTAMIVGFHTVTFFSKQENVKFDYDVTFAPSGPGGQYVVVGCSGWAVPAQAKYKEEGWKLVKYLVSLPVQKYIGEQKRWGVSLKEAVGTIEPDDKKPAHFAMVHTDPFKGVSTRKVITFKFPPQQSKIKEFYASEFDPIWQCSKSDVATAAANIKKQVDPLLASLNWF